MAVSGIPSAYSQGNGLIDLLNSLRESSEEISDEIGAGAAGSITATAQATLGKSSNMLSGNFASAASSESEYVAATKTAFKAFTQTANQQKSRLTNLLDSLVADYSPNVYERAGSKSGGMTAAGAYLLLKRQIRDPEEMEASERNLEEIKENIEHKAAEAMAPKDEEGNPIENMPNEDAAAASPPPEVSPPSDDKAEESSGNEVNESVQVDTAIAAYTAMSSIEDEAVATRTLLKV